MTTTGAGTRSPTSATNSTWSMATFDYDVTVPADMVVAGSGELTNPKAVLTPEQQARLAKARTSDATVTIRSPDDVAATLANPATGAKTWRFHMDHTRDVAFSASKTFVWDAARINLPDGKSSLAMSFYPRESVGSDKWGRSTEYMKDAVERFSKRWYPYEWPAAINIAGPATGMEYPGIVFDGVDDAGKQLFWISAHEIGHSWFPMIVGFDERRNAWMDEGFNTFIDVYESDDFNHGEYGPKRDGEYSPKGHNPVDEILPTINDPEAPVILTRADAIREKYRHPVTYFKSALGLVLLREQILGPDRFDPAFRKFIKDWAYKHPSPSDFFRAMESEGGEDLSYWWRGWYFNNWSLDMAAKGVDLRRRRSGQGRQGEHRQPRPARPARHRTDRLRGRNHTRRETARRDLDSEGSGGHQPRQHPAHHLGHRRSRPRPAGQRPQQQCVEAVGRYSQPLIPVKAGTHGPRFAP